MWPLGGQSPTGGSSLARCADQCWAQTINRDHKHWSSHMVIVVVHTGEQRQCKERAERVQRLQREWDDWHTKQCLVMNRLRPLLEYCVVKYSSRTLYCRLHSSDWIVNTNTVCEHSPKETTHSPIKWRSNHWIRYCWPNWSALHSTRLTGRPLSRPTLEWPQRSARLSPLALRSRRWLALTVTDWQSLQRYRTFIGSPPLLFRHTSRHLTHTSRADRVCLKCSISKHR